MADRENGVILGTRSLFSPDPVLQGDSSWQREEAKAGLLDPAQLSSNGFGRIIHELNWQDWPEVCGLLFKGKNLGDKRQNLALLKGLWQDGLPVQKVNSSQFLSYFWQLKLSASDPFKRHVRLMLQQTNWERNKLLLTCIPFKGSFGCSSLSTLTACHSGLLVFYAEHWISSKSHNSLVYFCGWAASVSPFPSYKPRCCEHCLAWYNHKCGDGAILPHPPPLPFFPRFPVTSFPLPTSKPLCLSSTSCLQLPDQALVSMTCFGTSHFDFSLENSSGWDSSLPSSFRLEIMG